MSPYSSIQLILYLQFRIKDSQSHRSLTWFYLKYEVSNALTFKYFSLLNYIIWYLDVWSKYCAILSFRYGITSRIRYETSPSRWRQITIARKMMKRNIILWTFILHLKFRIACTTGNRLHLITSHGVSCAWLHENIRRINIAIERTFLLPTCVGWRELRNVRFVQWLELYSSDCDFVKSFRHCLWACMMMINIDFALFVMPKWICYAILQTSLKRKWFTGAIVLVIYSRLFTWHSKGSHDKPYIRILGQAQVEMSR